MISYVFGVDRRAAMCFAGWCSIVAALVSTAQETPPAPEAPGEQTKAATAIESAWRRMRVDWSRAGESVLDLSGWLYAPAGRDGFVRSEGDHLVDGAGQRFRFWGVNLTGSDCFPPTELAAPIAEDLARLGVNCVRLHHLDSGWPVDLFADDADDTSTFDPAALERLDRFFAELKRRGVYVNLNLNVLRRYRAGDDVRDWRALGIGKGATYFNERLITLQEEFATRLLTHRNPHTGLEYRHDPAVAVVELVNENSLLEAWKSGRLDGADVDEPNAWSPLPISYADELTHRYNDWLADEAGGATLARLRAEAGVADDERVPRLKPGEFLSASVERFRLEASFLMELESRFFNRMTSLLRDELGVRSLLVGDADHADWHSGYAHQTANLTFDVIDGHGYWQHPSTGATYRTSNTPMVNDPLDSTVVQFARTPVAGRPFTISETGHLWPHRFASEGMPILTAYALLHDWDGVCWFSLGAERDRPAPPGDRQVYTFGYDPVKLAQLALLGQVFHAQQLAPAETSVTRVVDRTHAIESLRAPWDQRPWFHPDAKLGDSLRFKTRIVYSAEDGEEPPQWSPVERTVSDRYLAEGGQIAWTGAARGRGRVTLDAPGVQGTVGFVGGDGWRTQQLAFQIENDFACVLAASLDGEPIARSRRLLLVATAGARNTGMRWEPDGKTLADWGRLPVEVETVRGTVALSNSDDRAGQLRATPLGPLGEPIAARRAIADGVLALTGEALLWLVER